VRLTAGDTEAGLRADALVARIFEVSRSRAVQLIAEGRILLNSVAVKPDRRIKAGDVLEGDAPLAPPATLAPGPGSVPVVYRDDHLLVVDKPAGLVVHPGAGRRDGTMVNVLLGMGIPLAPAAGPVRPGVVHRLDRETSGLLVVASTDAAYWKLVKMIQRREVTREYQAVVYGVPDPKRGTISAQMGRDPRHAQKFAVVSSGGRKSVTHYEVEKVLNGASTVRITLGTGRTHQIRVHFAALGWPVLGDHVYGGTKSRTPLISRQALHAVRLSFAHPVTGKPVECKSPLPADIAGLVRELS
jgi:23S rRNA pseudouridine1911/1915/1917 synthase